MVSKEDENMTKEDKYITPLMEIVYLCEHDLVRTSVTEDGVKMPGDGWDDED